MDEKFQISASKPVDTLVKKLCEQFEKKYDLPMTSEDNYKLLDKMIIVGLKYDFFGKDGKVIEPEYEFLIDNEDPRYKVRGFIDKPIRYTDGSIKIVDYKSSKKKFSKDELDGNLQAMIYSLASKKFWPEFKPKVEFLFLKFPKSPSQELEFSEEELTGLEHYLAHVYQLINNFSEEDAKSNYAKNKDGYQWLCKAGRTWRCPYIDPFDYYKVVDKEGKTLRSSFKNDLKAKEGETIEKAKYEGCPAWPTKKEEQEIKDFFDF
ncbi:MAG TPA: hypothetical protein DEG69_12670 [Flavobacteriaceae bacterium]|nr:hypothetical protein [Flavobacteriaceae bacterium]